MRQSPVIFRCIFLISLCILTSTGCTRNNTPETALEEISLSIKQGDIEKARKRADSLYDVGVRNNDLKSQSYGLYGKAITDISNPSDGLHNNLDRAIPLAKKIDNAPLLSHIYNAKGIIYTSFDANYTKAREYFVLSLYYGRKANDKALEMRALCNLSDAFRMTNDTLGIADDRMVYEYAVKHNDRKLLGPAAQHCASYYLLNGKDWQKALPYIRMLESTGDSLRAFHFMANYYVKADSLDRALEYLNKARQIKPEASYLKAILGLILHRMGRSGESAKIFEEIISSEKISSNTQDYTPEMFLWLADDYHNLGLEDKAYAAMKQHTLLQDSMSTARAREDVARFKVLYDVEKKDRELKIKQQELNNRTIMAGSAITVALLIVVASAFYIVKKRKFYQLIVRQNKEFIKDKQMYMQRLNPPTPPAPTDSTGYSDTKMNEIWMRIEDEMERNKIYLDSSMTRDGFAKKVGCNHTWLSMVIKMKTGKTYLQFINRYRIDEAIRIISTVEKIMPLKDLSEHLGFLSTTTFYSAFKQQTGMTPTEYRGAYLREEQSRRMSREREEE